MFHKWGVSFLQTLQDMAFRAAPLEFMGTPWEEGDSVKSLCAGRGYWSHAISSENAKTASEAVWDKIKVSRMYSTRVEGLQAASLGNSGVFKPLQYEYPSMPTTMGIHSSSTGILSSQIKVFQLRNGNKSPSVPNDPFPWKPWNEWQGNKHQTNLSTLNGTRAMRRKPSHEGHRNNRLSCLWLSLLDRTANCLAQPRIMFLNETCTLAPLSCRQARLHMHVATNYTCMC